ncbi:WD40 repeat domain-containing protein [Streptomyces microflavus]|uniref:WD40 repeat domain-containing protein n=1 Tax=Streptomyces microflavus TaxID=1919 RepID=UPI00331C0C15
MSEQRLLPIAVRELLHGLPPGSDEWNLFHRLFGEDQPLWNFLIHCVAEADVQTLHHLMAGRTPLHDVLDEAPGYAALHDSADAPFVDGEPVPARALRAYAALGLALVGEADEAEWHLRTGASWLMRSAAAAHRPTSDRGSPSTPTGSLHEERLAVLLDSDHIPSEVFPQLCLVLLALEGALPRPVSGPRLTVLADRGQTGALFHLQLDLVRGLPSGLLPDPRSMSVFFGDEAFRRSLDDAWQTARPAKLHGAVLWSLRNADGPVDHVNDSSFGAAFAVLLMELGRTRGNWRGRLRLRRVNPRTSVIGAVNAKNPRVIESVTGYESKLSVVEHGHRVVVPKRDEEEARRHGGRATVVGAVTVEEAAKEVRRLDPRALSWLGAGVLAVLLAGSVVLWGAASDASEKNNRRAVAAELAAQAMGLKSTEPRTAGLLALAGYQIDPGNKEAKDAVEEVLETNRNTVRSWVADDVIVDVLAIDDAGNRAYTSGADDVIRVWDTRSKRKLAEVPGRAAGMVRGTESGFLAAHDGRVVRLFDASGDEPELEGEVKAPSCIGPYGEIVGMGFTSNGSELTTVWDEGAVTTVDPVTRTVTGCMRLKDIAGKKLLDQLPVGRTTISADVVASYSGPGGGDDQAVLLLTTNEVVAVDLRTKKVSVLIPGAEVPGEATLVQSSHDTVTLATGGGVLAWDRVGRKRIAYPLGGLSSRPEAMEQDGDHVVIAGKSGTAVIPVRPGIDTASEPLSVPTGGRSVAAVRASDGTVVAAGSARVTVLGNHAAQRALPSADLSTSAAFGSGHTLLLTDYMTNTSHGLYTIDLDTKPNPAGAAPPSYEHSTEYSASSAYINDVAISDKFVVAAGQNRGFSAVTVWKRDGTFQQELLMSPVEDRQRKAEERIAAQVAFAPEANVLVARNAVGEVAIWSTKTWDLLGMIPLKSTSTAMAIHGRTGAFTEGTGKQTRVVLVDLVTRKRLRTSPAPDVARLSVAKDGSRLLAYAWTTNVISVLDPRELTAIRKPLKLPPGEPARDVAISPDGRLVASAVGGQVLVHNLTTGQQAMPPLRDSSGGIVVQLTWSPDGAYLTGVTLLPERERKRPGTVNIWKLAEGSLERRMCDWADGGLSDAEWKQYVDESVDYIDLCKGVTE